MKKFIYGIPVLILVAVVLAVMVSVFTPGTDKEKEPEGDISLYYISADGYAFKKVPYQFVSAGQPVDMAKEVLEQLKQVP